MRSIFLCDNRANVDRVFATDVRKRLERLVGLEKDVVYSTADLTAAPDKFGDVEIIFSTWGMPTLDEEVIAKIFPSLRAIFYAAGTVQAFARPFLAQGIKIFSAWAANAYPVAEYTTSQILLANKGFFTSSATLSTSGDYRSAQEIKSHYRGNYGADVGIIGAGMIGSLVVTMLREHNLNAKVFDPFLPDDRARDMGVTKCSLDELFSTCNVVSNHLANNEQTKGMLCYKHFSSMLPYATFINTGRGAQVVEDDLVRALAERPDLTALLDVTYPEPPRRDHPFFELKNCFLTPHIAGSIGDEVHRMAVYMADECQKLISGNSTKYEVTEKMLATMA